MTSQIVRRALAVVVVMTSAACSTESKTADSAAMSSDTSAMTPPAAATMTPIPAPATSGMMDPGSATQAEIATIPGVGDAVAAQLVSGRPYTNMLGVEKVLVQAKLTEAQRDSVYTRLWTPIDVNKASKAEIMLIPGVGERMHKEFAEYRPYTSVEQFRRDIGKYVDKAELARLEQFIVIR